MSAPASFREKLHSFLDPSDGAGPAERAFNALLVTLILLTIAVTIAGTVPEVQREYGRAIRLFDYVCAFEIGRAHV